MATGGVSMERIPKYRRKRCAAIGTKPSFSMAGAINMASNI